LFATTTISYLLENHKITKQVSNSWSKILIVGTTSS
jgi:hypothetical protein